MKKITSRFAPSIVRAALALEAATAYFDRYEANKLFEPSKAVDARKGAIRMTDVAWAASTNYQAPGADALRLIDECTKEMQAERVRHAKERRARQERLMLEREQAQMLIAA